MFVSNLLGRAQVKGFGGLLERCLRIDHSSEVFIDGGAGLGETAEEMIGAMPAGRGRIFAFEPNPMNTRYFRDIDSRINLRQQAISDYNGVASFAVSSMTKSGSDNPYHQEGTSYVGKLAPGEAEAGVDSFDVEVTRLDDALAKDGVRQVDFMKLDLQGAESEAISGLGELLPNVKWMWIEFSNQSGLLDILRRNNFYIFDTEYLFVGEPSDLIREMFHISRAGRNSIGKQVFFGRRRHMWLDYERGFDFSRRNRRMIQTDIAAVHPSYMPIFLEAVADMIPPADEGLEWTIPRNLF